MVNMTSPFRKLSVKSSEEIIDKAFRRAFRRPITAPKKLKGIDRLKYVERVRVEIVGSIAAAELEKVYKSFPDLSSIHPFYQQLADIIAGIGRLRHCLGAAKWAELTVRKITREYMSRITLSSEKSTIISLRREATGRIASVLSDISEELSDLKKYASELRSLPSIDPDTPTIVVAGYPNTGKSTLVGKLSTAEPEVAYYPFTTRSLILGHMLLHNTKVQLVDTPGMLDRPPSRMKRMELQALAALKSLADIVVFMIDPSETCGYQVRKQLHLLEEISSHMDKPTIVALNKMDLADHIPKLEEKASKAEAALKEAYKVVRISAEAGIGLDHLLKLIEHMLFS